MVHQGLAELQEHQEQLVLQVHQELVEQTEHQEQLVLAELQVYLE
jgi:hypothetical protein